VPANVLAAAFYSVVSRAFDRKDLIDLLQSVECVLFVEGPTAPILAGSLMIMRLELERIDEFVDAYLAAPKDPEGQGNPDYDLMICAIGSSVFCQDIARFAVMDRNGKIDSSFERFTSRIMYAEPGEVIWTDTRTKDMCHTDSLIELFFKAKRDGIIPD
jgi:hypothetical protein